MPAPRNPSDTPCVSWWATVSTYSISGKSDSTARFFSLDGEIQLSMFGDSGFLGKASQYQLGKVFVS